MVVSTGVGGGLIMDGRAVAGADRQRRAHRPRVASTRPVRSVSAAGSVAWKRLPAVLAGGLGQRPNGFSRAATAAPSRSRDAAARGDRIALAAFRRSGEALGLAIAGAVTLLDLDLVVIGGGVAAAGPLLFEPLAAAYSRYAALGFAAEPRVVPAPARVPTAGLIGAAAVVLVPDAYWPTESRRHRLKPVVAGPVADAGRMQRMEQLRNRISPGSEQVRLDARHRRRGPGRRRVAARGRQVHPDGVVPAAGQAVGGPVYLKCENLQRTGSFKIRGAYVRIARLSEQEKAAGVVAASAGNHAQGVALAASLVGSTATVYMPVGASIAKLTATRAYGAHVELVGESLDDALEAAHGVRRPDRRRAGAPVRPSRTCCAGRAPSVWRSLSRCPTSPPWWSRPAAAG